MSVNIECNECEGGLSDGDYICCHECVNKRIEEKVEEEAQSYRERIERLENANDILEKTIAELQ